MLRVGRQDDYKQQHNDRTTTVSRTDVARGGAGVTPPAVLGEWTRVGLAQQRLEPPTRSTGRVSVRACISGVARKP